MIRAPPISGDALFTSRTTTSPSASQTATIASVSVTTPAGYLSTSTTNALGQTETRVVDPRFGVATSLTGPNSLTTTWTLDDFGRKILETDTDRGFTGHQHLDDVGLIHMNGRIYDPNIGRFLQADLYIQEPDYLQAYNRYSYVLNNPLNGVDPTGQLSFLGWAYVAVIGARVLGIIDTKTMRNLMGLLAATSWMMPGNLLANAGIHPAMQAVFAGFVGGMIASGPEGAAQWGTSALLFTGAGLFATHILGSPIDGFSFGRVLSHAGAGCISAEISGGECGDGARQAGITKALGSAIPDSSDYVLNTVKYMMIGGIVSKVGGEKFANGAMMGAFQYLFNQVVSRKSIFGAETAAERADRCSGLTAEDCAAGFRRPMTDEEVRAMKTNVANLGDALDKAGTVTAIACTAASQPCAIPAALLALGGKGVNWLLRPPTVGEFAYDVMATTAGEMLPTGFFIQSGVFLTFEVARPHVFGYPGTGSLNNTQTQSTTNQQCPIPRKCN